MARSRSGRHILHRPTMPSLSRLTTGTVVLMIGLSLLAVFVGKQRAEERFLPKPTGESGSTALRPYYTQKLTWKACGSSICSWVKVPVDYDKPAGETLRLRVKLRPADDSRPKSHLFINPGGPGGSGVDYVDPFAESTSKAVRSTYDIVGWDPRGVGLSTPLKCLTASEFDRFNRLDFDPDDRTEVTELEDGFASIGKKCVKNSGSLAAHVSTVENVRDLDILRALVGEHKLDFYGASYGTQLGATYADRYPQKVHAMVLDGGVDPKLSKERLGWGQAKSFDTALRSFLKNCIADGNCPLGKTVPEALNGIEAMLNELDKKPMKTAGDRTLTQGSARYGIAYSLYNTKAWPVLATALQRASFGDGTVLLALADRYFGRQSDGSYSNNGSQAVYAVRCLDYPVAPDRAAILALLPKYQAVSPIFGQMMAWTAAECSDWPVKSKTPQRAVKAKGAPPILVIGTSRDPATPFSWSKSLAKQLDSGMLVTRVGDGHTGYGLGNACIDRAVNRYLLSGTKPRKGLVCNPQ